MKRFRTWNWLRKLEGYLGEFEALHPGINPNFLLITEDEMEVLIDIANEFLQSPKANAIASYHTGRGTLEVVLIHDALAILMSNPVCHFSSGTELRAYVGSMLVEL